MMKKLFILSVMSFYAMPTLAGVDTWAKDYQSFKTDLQNKLGL